MTRFFLDTESGAEFYAESRDVDLSKANPWVREHVLPYLGQWDEADDPVEPWPNDRIAGMLTAFVASELEPYSTVEFWTYFGDYDWVVTCQLFGTMMDLPEGWPMFAYDLKQLSVQVGNPDLPKQVSTEHHALADAHWNRDVYGFLYGEWRSRIYDAITDEAGYLPEADRLNATISVLNQLGWP